MVFGDLTAKELQALALIAQGHDAKSAARELGVSAHTIYERLRRAREKVGANNSREAARFIFSGTSADLAESNENLVAQKLVLSDAVAFDPHSMAFGAPSGRASVPDRGGIAGYTAFSFLFGPDNALPARAADERDIAATTTERLRLIGELSARLAMAFAAICLAATLVNTLLLRR